MLDWIPPNALPGMRRAGLRFMGALLLLAVVAGITPAAAQDTEALNIGPIPEGELPPERLTQIAADIHRLADHPLAPDARQARKHLFAWISKSPDVSVSICGDIAGPLLKSKSAYHSDLLMQYIFASAAHRIEHPEASEAKVQAAGMQGALDLYRTLRAQVGKKAKDKHMESLLKKAKHDKLDAYLLDKGGKC